MPCAESLVCLNCGAKYDIGWHFEGCKRCECEDFVSNLAVNYDYEKLKESVNGQTFERPLRLWGYKDLLPVEEERNIVSLGEGNTPLLKLRRLAEEMRCKNLYVKNEAINPTLSYKDRFASVAVSKGVELGATRTVVSSSGNHGSAAAAYSAKAGLDCIVFTLASAPDTMVSQMRAYSKNVFQVSSSEGRWAMMKKCVEELHTYPLSTYTKWPTGNPYGVEGYKTIAYEIFSQMNMSVPDYVVVPVGYGDGLYGIWKGFSELALLGMSNSVPRMISVETSAGAPLHEAYKSGSSKINRVPIKHPTVAFSIMTQVCGFHALYALKSSHGLSSAIDDQGILNAQTNLARLEGIAAEASSAASVAAIDELVNTGEIDRDSQIVCILTSSALKQIDVNSEWARPKVVFDADWDRIKGILQSVQDQSTIETKR